MRIVMTSLAVLALVACNKPADKTADANMADENMAMNVDEMDANAMDANTMATPAAFNINETSWEFTDAKTKKPIQESVDATGKYIATSGTEHFDHGTAVMKGGKVCFTSAMNKDGEMCWTDPKAEVGASGETVNDKGEKLTVKRIAYVAKTM